MKNLEFAVTVDGKNEPLKWISRAFVAWYLALVEVSSEKPEVQLFSSMTLIERS